MKAISPKHVPQVWRGLKRCFQISSSTPVRSAPHIPSSQNKSMHFQKIVRFWNSQVDISIAHLRDSFILFIANLSTCHQRKSKAEEQCRRLRMGQKESQDGMRGLAKCGEELAVQPVDGTECGRGELSFLHDWTKRSQVCCARHSIP